MTAINENSDIDGRTLNDIKIFDMMLRDNEFYIVAIQPNYALNIYSKSRSHEYALRFKEIKKVHFINSKCTQFIMNNGSYLFINYADDILTVGL